MSGTAINRLGRALLFLALGAAPVGLAQTVPPNGYRLTELRAAPTHRGGIAFALNRTGTVVGWGQNVDPDPTDEFEPPRQPAVWQPPGYAYEPIAISLDPSIERLVDINDAGLLLATTVVVDGSDETALPLLDQFLNSGALGHGLNNFGAVAGMCELFGGERQAVVWSSALVPSALSTLPNHVTSESYAINDSGAAVGYTEFPDADERYRHATRWVDGGVLDLGTLGGISSEAVAINGAGVIVGGSEIETRESRGFVWDAINGMQRLAATAGIGGYNAIARGINDAGLIVGSGTINPGGGQTEAFIWDANGVHRLRLLIKVGLTGFSAIFVAYDINDRGQIAGYGRKGGVFTPFLLTPIPARGDTNCDGTVDAFDIGAFVTALTGQQAGYETQFPDCDFFSADINGDEQVDSFDLALFVDCLVSGGCP